MTSTRQRLSASRVSELRPEVGTIVADLLDAMEASPARVGDLPAEYPMQIPSKVICNLLGALVRDAGDDLTNEELTGLAMITLVSGLENTASTISLSVIALPQHPDQLAVVRDDESSTRRAVDELLRYTSLVTSPPETAW